MKARIGEASIEKKVAFHVMEASPNIDGALIWAKID